MPVRLEPGQYIRVRGVITSTVKSVANSLGLRQSRAGKVLQELLTAVTSTDGTVEQWKRCSTMFHFVPCDKMTGVIHPLSGECYSRGRKRGL